LSSNLEVSSYLSIKTKSLNAQNNMLFNFDPMFFIPLLILGAFSGFLAGLLGVGGGLIIVPILAYILENQGVANNHLIQTAIGTTFGVMMFTSLSSLRAHNKTGAIVWPVVFRFTPGLLIGTTLGSKIAHLLPGKELGIVFCTFIVFSGIQMLLDKKPKPSRELPNSFGLITIASIIGVMSSLVGAGGGFIAVPFMVWCNIQIKNAVATSAAMGFPLAVFAMLGYLFNGPTNSNSLGQSVGYIYLPAVFWLACTSVLTAPVGAALAHQLPVKTLKKAFAYMLFGLAALMFNKVF
jgi:uncharacterized protein